MPGGTLQKTTSMGGLMIRGAWETVAHKQGELPDALTNRAKVTVRRVEVVPPPEYAELDVQRIRQRLGVSQTVFAHLLGASPATVRAWERGARKPSQMARRLLEVMERRPEAFAEALVAS